MLSEARLNLCSYQIHLHKKKSSAAIACVETDVELLPILENGHFCGTFTGLFVEVSDQSHKKILYERGCFGKGSLSRGAPRSATETLVLDLEESFFLAYVLKALKIYDTTNHQINWKDFLKISTELSPDFEECFAAYLYLKSKGWVVKSGFKYGGKFSLYKIGPEIYHASFVVYVSLTYNLENSGSGNIHLAQRIGGTAKKDVLHLEISKPENFVIKALDDFKCFFISEIIYRRFNFTQFINST